MKYLGIATIVALSLLSVLSCFAQTKVRFVVTDLPSASISEVGLRGNVAPLDWDNSIALQQGENGFETIVSFTEPADVVEFKFVIVTTEGELRWEGTENRTLQLESGVDTTSSIHRWDREQVIDPATLTALSPQQLMEDFQLVKEMILKVHPGTYRYRTKSEVQQSLDDLEKKFSDSLSHGEAYLAISKLLASIQCDHTFASFYNQNRILKSVIHWQKDKLPFAFKWVDERMVITYSATKELERGQEILSIDGKKVSDIGKSLLPYVSADGATDRSRWAKLEVNGYDFRWSDFDVFYPLVYPVSRDSLEVDVYDFTTEKTSQVTVPWMTLDDRWEVLVRNETFPAKRDDLLSFTINEGVGIMKLGSFGTFGWKRLEKDYREFFAEVFSRVHEEKVKHLIIDMRENNGGGDEMAEELMTYLDVDRLIIDDRVGKTRFTTFPESLKPYCQTWGDTPWYYQMEPEAIEGEYFVFAEGAQLNEKNRKKKNHFRGDLYWLTSPANVSLAYYTETSVRKYGLGLLIGEETGGNLQGINGGQILFLRLPNSQIEIDFPVMGDFSIKDQPNEGVKPDYLVKPQASDIARNMDRQLDYAMTLIKESK